MVWSENRRQPFEEEIFDGCRHGVHRNVQLVDVHAVVVVKFLEYSREKTILLYIKTHLNDFLNHITFFFISKYRYIILRVAKAMNKGRYLLKKFLSSKD